MKRKMLRNGLIAGIIFFFISISVAPGINGNVRTIEDIEFHTGFRDGAWTYKSPMPTRRLDSVSAVVNGKIYVIGGWIPPAGAVTDKVEVYDPRTDSWEEKASMPIASVHTAAAAFNNKIYVFGGEGPSVGGFHNGVFEYDVEEDRWAYKNPMPNYRYAPAAVVVGDKIYLIGGYGMDTNWEYNPVNDTWNERASMPTRRNHLGATVVNNKIYCIGGRAAYHNPPMDVVEAYDPSTDTWETKTSMPTPRAGFYEIAVFNDKIYVIGGEQGNPVEKTFDENEVYDPLTDTWTSEAPMPIRRHGMSVGVVDDKIYCVGGGEMPFYSWGNITLEFNPTFNNPPNKPSKPVGSTSGKPGISYQYESSTTDPNGDQVYYLFDWGDGSDSGWIGPEDSGEIVEASHSWSEQGNYEIKVKAKDIYNTESEWSDPLPVSMPKTYENPLWTLIERLFDWLEQIFTREILPGIFNL